MTKVKIFHETDEGKLEQKINNFLVGSPRASIVDIKFSASAITPDHDPLTSFAALVIYTE